MRRPLRRSRHVYNSLVPITDSGYGVEPSANDPDVAILRQEERFKAVGNEVADAVIYHFQSVPQVTNAIRMRLYGMAIARFRNRLPPEMIRSLVDVTIWNEMRLRKEMARERAAEAARKAERSAGRATVVQSAP